VKVVMQYIKSTYGGKSLAISILDDEGNGHGTRILGKKLGADSETLYSWELNDNDLKVLIDAAQDLRRELRRAKTSLRVVE